MTCNRSFTAMAAILIACAGLLPASCAGPANTIGSPEWLVNMYFAQKDFPEKDRYLTGEMADYPDRPTFGASMHDGVRVTYHELYRDDTSAVFTVNASDTSDGLDFYCFLQNSKGWQIEAIRTLALTGFVHMMIDSLKTYPNLDDSLTMLLNQLELLVSRDSTLSAHFTDNRSAFRELLNAYQNKDEKQVEADVRNLSLTGLYEDPDNPGCIFFLIGGVVDNEAGYIYAENDDSVPRMSSHRFILIQKLASHWYLYKTT